MVIANIGQSESTAVMTKIQRWEHWGTIQQVVQKEYQVSQERFEQLLPEYQRFLGLIALGYSNLGMFSEDVDKLWHAHILHTELYRAFCMTIFGRFIDHIPNLGTTGQECTTPDDICTNKCNGSCKTPPPSCSEEKHGGSLQRFLTAYTSAYGEQPGRIWDLPESDGQTA